MDNKEVGYSRTGQSLGFRCYNILNFRIVEARGPNKLSDKLQDFYVIVMKMLGQIQRLKVNSYQKDRNNPR